MSNSTAISGIGGSGMSGMGGMSGMNAMGGMGSGMTQMPGMAGMTGMMGGMMMYFHAGNTEYILFEELHTSTGAEMAGACVVIFLATLLYEVFKWLREELLRRHNVQVAHLLQHGTPEEKAEMSSIGRQVFSRSHALQTLMHGIQFFWGYCLMLVFMTYNAYLCLSMVLGATVGFFIAGWSRTHATDQNEHCH